LFFFFFFLRASRDVALHDEWWWWWWFSLRLLGAQGATRRGDYLPSRPRTCSVALLPSQLSPWTCYVLKLAFFLEFLRRCSSPRALCRVNYLHRFRKSSPLRSRPISSVSSVSILPSYCCGWPPTRGLALASPICAHRLLGLDPVAEGMPLRGGVRSRPLISLLVGLFPSRGAVLPSMVHAVFLQCLLLRFVCGLL